ncbi:MAG: primosomal protein N' [Candidatus Eremiobacteraeota bacterium]|nr:primosomal protein N' [Candidatus Eremiobacteraeota bacterium]
MTYTCDFAVCVGDIVRVPLGSRDVLAFVISDPTVVKTDTPLKAAVGRVDAPRAFTAIGLALARFVADRYVCTLGEALSSVVLAQALPRMVDAFVRSLSPPKPERFPSVPKRFLALVWETLEDGFGLETLLRHPEARRTGDRSTLMRHVNALVRAGALRRERSFLHPRTHEYRIKALFPGDAAIAGAKAKSLVTFVNDRPGVPRADALLAGFSNAVIMRARKAGAIHEREVAPARDRQASELGGPAFRATAEQQSAIDLIVERFERGMFAEILLHGITGSGKTFVYIEAIKVAVRAGGRAIVLVPEISLTPQTARRFESVFGHRVAVLHSALSDRERYDAWQACAHGAIDVVVGARSAVFAPLDGVRLLVVDEAHETTYKQDSVPRYHAVAVARERMKRDGGVLVLGSATPTLESYADALEQKIEWVRLRHRATEQPLPPVRIVDMGKEFETGNRRIFSAALTQALDDRLRRGEKSVLFVNRRGSAGFLLCRTCGFVPQCSRCTVSLTAHRSENLLRCHYCDAQHTIPIRCPVCGGDAIREFGAGTEKVAEHVARLYPAANVIRMDSDTTTRVGDHARLLDAFGSTGDVLVGTQMVAKGLDFPTVTLVGVVAADIGLHAPDFRAAERSFDVITQVCGRSGRSRPGEAIVQTYSPTHPAIVFAATHDYDGFAKRELEDRRAVGYPPCSDLLYLGVIGRSRARAFEQARCYADILRESGSGEVLGPAPFPIARLNQEWRFRVALKGLDGEAMRAAVREGVLPRARADRGTRIAVNVDP